MSQRHARLDRTDTRREPVSDGLAEILEGMALPRKMLPPKFFYDERGSELFEQICELPEYYLTRAEQSS